MSTEQERASLFRQQCANRAQWRRDQLAALQGDDTAAARVASGFAPLLRSPDDAWDCLDPEDVEIPRPNWLSRVPGDIELPEHLQHRR